MSLPGRHNLRWIAGIALLAWMACAQGASLGQIEVLSYLGQPLRAHVPLTGFNRDDGVNCIKTSLRSFDNGTVVTPRAGLVQKGQSSYIQLTTRLGINDPVLHLSISLGCDVALHREYQILLDPSLALPAVPRAETTAAPIAEKRVRSSPAPRVVSRPPADADADAVSVPAPRKAKPVRNKAVNDTAVSNAAESNVAATAPSPPKQRLKKASRAERNVLRLSAAPLPVAGSPAAASGEVPADPLPNSMQLKRADTLSLPTGPTDLARMVELQAEQEKFAALMRDEDPVKSIQQSMKKMQADMDLVRAETARMSQQSQADKTALLTFRTESLNWIATLGGLLLLCVAAVVWLMWRLAAARNDVARAEWAALIAARNTQTNFSLIDNRVEGVEESFPQPIDPGVALPEAEAETEVEAEAQAEAQVQTVLSPSEILRQEIAQRRARREQTPVAASVPAPAPVAEEAKEEPSFKHDRSGLKPYVFLQPGEAARKEDHTVKAEEISDVVELAEAWMALNDPHKVLELLDPFSAVEHPESPLPWLCLLEVYRTLGQQEKYEAILERIKSRFNVKLAPWDKEVDEELPKTLADYPHISENILRLWPDSDEAIAYMEQLQRDNRQGTRNGFDLPVYRDILKLINLAENADRSSGQAALSERARAILLQEKVALPGASLNHAASRPAQGGQEAQDSSASAVKTLIRNRPKYITTSYQRVARNEDRPVEQAAEKPAENIPDKTEESSPGKPAVPVPSNKWPTIVRKTSADAATAVAPSRQAASAAVAAQVAPAPAPVPKAVVPEPKKMVAQHEDLCPIGVKLHLAVAYHDIGDKEGAFVLLDEVIDDGTPAQVEQAKRLMVKFDL
jgi:FimV-like protein